MCPDMFSPQNQCCQLSDFVARFSDFSDPFSDFKKKKRLATNLATFGKTLATFKMSPVLSCEREILSYTSPCVCSHFTNHLPASPLFEIKLFNLTVFYSTFFFISCTYIIHCHRALVHSSF